MLTITDEMLNALRKSVSGHMSEKRYAHTLAVEEMTARLCRLFCPEQTSVMRAAALLHDITKELSVREHLEICQAQRLQVTEEDRIAWKTLHARTAAALIPIRYPEFSDPIVVSAVRWHTTGHADMTLTEQILYFADYIDATRTYPACVALREAFWNASPQDMEPDERIRHFHTVLFCSFEITLRELLEEDLPISLETVAARNQLLLQCH